LHNIPNPFGTTSLYTSLNILSPKQGKLSLNVYNIKGQLVNTLYNNDVQKKSGHSTLVGWEKLAGQGIVFGHLSLPTSYREQIV